MNLPPKMITYLRMTDPSQLIPGKTSPDAITVEPTGDQELLRPIYEDLAASWNWPCWSEWAEGFNRPHRYFFVIRASDRPIGLAKFILDENAVMIDNFGLMSTEIGKGFGGEALTRVIETAWELSGGTGLQRPLCLDTCNWDHPHALANYKARGFIEVLTETHEEATARNREFPHYL